VCLVKSTIPAPTPEKLAAWAKVREIWKASKHVNVMLLDAEYEAKETK
jgi:hypothetical protein